MTAWALRVLTASVWASTPFVCHLYFRLFRWHADRRRGGNVEPNPAGPVQARCAAAQYRDRPSLRHGSGSSRPRARSTDCVNPAIRCRLCTAGWDGIYALAALLTGLGGLVFIVAGGTVGGPVMSVGFAGYGLLMVLASVEATRVCDGPRH